jgi:hypothetical protein
MFIIPAGTWTIVLVSCQVFVQLCCLLAVVSIVGSLRLGSWMAWLYAIAVLAPMVPFVLTFHLVRSVSMYTIPSWMLALSAAAPIALCMIAIRCRAGSFGLVDARSRMGV